MTAGAFMLEEVRTFRQDIAGGSVTPADDVADLAERLGAYDFAESMSLAAVLRDVAGMMRRWTLHATSPRYFGLFVPGVTEAGIWADALTALYNPQLGATWHAPAAAQIESHTLRYLARLLGYDAARAQFTTGGSEANLLAVLAAIERACPEAIRDGAACLARHTVYISDQAHHSVQRAVRVAGLGDRALRLIPCDASHRIDVTALRAMLRRDVEQGFVPLMIVATVGTTTAGAVDDLLGVAPLASEFGAWLHADAAWGGIAALTPQLGDLLAGIDLADSVAWDAHKTLSVPMGAGIFFSRHSSALAEFFRVEAPYLPGEADGDDLYLTSLQWSRRFIGLKVFVTLASRGQAALAAETERKLLLADHLRDRLRAAGWTLMNDTRLPLVCFARAGLSDDRLRNLVSFVTLRGTAWISDARLAGQTVLRACITNDDTTFSDVDVLCKEIELAFRAVLLQS